MNMKGIRANALLISHCWLSYFSGIPADADFLKKAEYRHYKLVQYLERKGE